MSSLKYIAGYPPALQDQVQQMIDKGVLGTYLKKKHPESHQIRSDVALRDYVMGFKNQYLKKAPPLSKVIFDSKIHVIHNALGTHRYVSRVQGKKLKSKNEIRIASVFKKAPSDLLQMIVVHELAHLKEKEHNKAFYKLCENMLPDYHQCEFEMRLYLTHVDQNGSP